MLLQYNRHTYEIQFNTHSMWSNTTTDGFADADTYIDPDFNGLVFVMAIFKAFCYDSRDSIWYGVIVHYIDYTTVKMESDGT